MRMYHLCKLNICVPSLISSSSVTRGFPSLNGWATTSAIEISAVPAAWSSVNPVSWRNLAYASFGCLPTTRGSSWFCTEPSWGTVFPHFLFFLCYVPLSACDQSPRVVMPVGCSRMSRPWLLFVDLPVPFSLELKVWNVLSPRDPFPHQVTLGSAHKLISS